MQGVPCVRGTLLTFWQEEKEYVGPVRPRLGLRVSAYEKSNGTTCENVCEMIFVAVHWRAPSLTMSNVKQPSDDAAEQEAPPDGTQETLDTAEQEAPPDSTKRRLTPLMHVVVGLR